MLLRDMLISYVFVILVLKMYLTIQKIPKIYLMITKIRPSSPLVPSQATVESRTSPTSTGGTLRHLNRVR